MLSVMAQTDINYIYEEDRFINLFRWQDSEDSGT